MGRGARDGQGESERRALALALRLRAIHQAKLAALGLLLLLVPIVLTWKSIEHAHKLVRRGLTTIAPGVEMVGGAAGGVLILLGILVVCWVLGFVVMRTVFGARWRAWERTEFLGRSALVQKLVKHLTDRPSDAKGPNEAEDAPVSPQPALARIAGTWQPCVVVQASVGGWSLVLVPDVPTLAAGRLYCVPDADILPLDADVGVFRDALGTSGRGSASASWLRALGAREQEQTR